jgi:hypothetical protein
MSEAIGITATTILPQGLGLGPILSDGLFAGHFSRMLKSDSEQCTFPHQDLQAASDLPVEAGFSSSLASMEALSTALQAVVLHGSQLILKADEAFSGTDTALSQGMLAAL